MMLSFVVWLPHRCGRCGTWWALVQLVTWCGGILLEWDMVFLLCWCVLWSLRATGDFCSVEFREFIPSGWFQEAFWQNSNSVQNSVGIIWSISQAPLPNLIPPEFWELPGFQPESVEDNKDLLLTLLWLRVQCMDMVIFLFLLKYTKDTTITWTVFIHVGYSMESMWFHMELTIPW